MFKVTVKGLDKLDKEFGTKINEIQKKIPSALEMVATEMINSLRDNITETVYERYTPREYIRRTEGGSYAPLESKDYMEYSTSGSVLQFGYFPSGEHENKEWHKRDKDDLIKWLQKSHGRVPARPFWEIFLAQQETESISTFAEGMKPFEVTVSDSERLDLSVFSMGGTSRMDELFDSESE